MSLHARTDQWAKFLLAAIFAVGGLAIAPAQFTDILRADLWAFPSFLGLIIVGLFGFLARYLIMTRRYKGEWRTEHPSDSEMVESERQADKIAATSPEAKAARKEYLRQSRKLGLLMFGPLLIGFIPLLLIDAALNISGNTARVEILIYFVLYFTVVVLALRRGAGRRIKLLKTIQLPSRSFSSPREDEDSTVRKLKGATDSDLELCPHCGSAVSREVGKDCQICGKPLN
jgi:hypothetical protein